MEMEKKFKQVNLFNIVCMMYKGKEFAKQIHLIPKNATTGRKACLKKTTNKQENKISLTQMPEVKLYMKVVKYLPDNKSYSYIKKKLYKCGIFTCNLCPGNSCQT